MRSWGQVPRIGLMSPQGEEGLRALSFALVEMQ